MSSTLYIPTFNALTTPELELGVPFVEGAAAIGLARMPQGARMGNLALSIIPDERIAIRRSPAELLQIYDVADGCYVTRAVPVLVDAVSVIELRAAGAAGSLDYGNWTVAGEEGRPLRAYDADALHRFLDLVAAFAERKQEKLRARAEAAGALAVLEHFTGDQTEA